VLGEQVPVTAGARGTAGFACIASVAAVCACAMTGTNGPDATADPAPRAAVDRADPEACRPCHADHVREWSGSMHAYAADDPIFVAMNARGQRETGGALGAFCVTCHAPMAVREGATTDGANLARVPRSLHGVTCAFCHTVDAVLDTHDGALRLAGDGVFRGGIADPAPGGFHAAAYSPIHDRTRAESARLCGACHDVVTPAGAVIERTFAEWQASPFAPGGPAGAAVKTCGGCHMPAHFAPAAVLPGADPSRAAGKTRRVHDHTMAALDVALGPFPEADAQRRAVQAGLAATLSAELCVRAAGAGVAGATSIDVTLSNARAGHAWPSGATHDRRAWLELQAFAGGMRVWADGAAEAGEDATVALGATLFGPHGEPVDFAWEAAGLIADTLAPAVAVETARAVAPPRTAHFDAPAGVDRVTMRVRVTPLRARVAAALVASGDLDPAVAGAVPTFDLTTTALEWTKDRAEACVR
jgi:hypothetical protein